MEPMIWYMLGKQSTNKLHLQAIVEKILMANVSLISKELIFKMLIGILPQITPITKKSRFHNKFVFKIAIICISNLSVIVFIMCVLANREI